MFAKLVALFAIVAVAIAKPQYVPYLTADNTGYVNTVPLAYNTPVAYQASPVAYQAAPVAYQAAPVAYQTAPVAYQAGTPVTYQAAAAVPLTYPYTV